MGDCAEGMKNDGLREHREGVAVNLRVMDLARLRDWG